MHHPRDRIAHTTAFVTPVVEHWLDREIAQWVHSVKDRSDDPTCLVLGSYIELGLDPSQRVTYCFIYIYTWPLDCTYFHF